MAAIYSDALEDPDLTFLLEALHLGSPPSPRNNVSNGPAVSSEANIRGKNRRSPRRI